MTMGNRPCDLGAFGGVVVSLLHCGGRVRWSCGEEVILFHLAFSIGFNGKTKGETMGSLTCLVIVFIGLIIYCYNSCGS